MKKKIISLALVLCLTLLPATALAADELPAPTDLVWGINRHTYYGTKQSESKAIPGYISWYSSLEQDGGFLVRIYNTNDPVSPIVERKMYYSGGGFHSSGLFIEGDKDTGCMESGTYYFTVQMLGDGERTADSAVATSPTWSYIKPEKKLNPPNAPVFEYPVIHWETSADNREFESELSFSPDGITLKPISWSGPAECSTTGIMVWQEINSWGPGNYYMRVRAISQDITQALNSDWSEYSAPYVWEGGEKLQYDYRGPYHDRYLDILEHLDETLYERVDLNEQMRKAWSETDPAKYTLAQSRHIITQSNQICAGLSSDYEKAKAIYGWVTENIAYDHLYLRGDKMRSPTTPEEVLDSRLAICNGFSRLTQALLLAQNIPAVYIAGYANGAYGWDNHAWNLAYVGGRWIYMDPTWGRPTSAGPNGEEGYHGYDPDWFDPTPEFFAQKHVAKYSSYDPYNSLECTPYPAVSATAAPNRSTVLVNGQSVAFDAYTINQNNYFKLRDLAKVLSGTGKQFEVTWDGASNAINMLSDKPYTAAGGELAQGDGANKTASLNTAIIYLDGKPVQLTAYTINQNNYFKLRDVGQTFNFDVTWDGANSTIAIDTTKSYTPD